MAQLVIPVADSILTKKHHMEGKQKKRISLGRQEHEGKTQFFPVNFAFTVPLREIFPYK